MRIFKNCAWVTVFLASALSLAAAADPTDNPVATCYDGPEGYPAWTDRIPWQRVINMRTYDQGKTNFEKFESARDELAAQGGGVLYYPAGTYDFTQMPADGPTGRGLMLKSGVVIRGETPPGKPWARDGKLELATKFIFGFQKRRGGEVPRAWNLIGLAPGKGQGVKDVQDVGIAWVELTGAVVYFGPDVQWGPTWDSAKSWLSRRVAPAWAKRVPDGQHPLDPFVGGETKYLGMGRGRLVFGCSLLDSCVTCDYLSLGAADDFHTERFTGRIGVYGSEAFVANNFLPASRKNFKYQQGGRTDLFDYGKTMGLDVNKDLLGWVRDDGKCPGYFAAGVVVRDNWVFNHGHKGYNLSGNWGTFVRNHNERKFLESGDDVYGLGGGWTLTLDGKDVAKGASDNLARAFDLAGKNLWIDHNTFNNCGSEPGNDGEGILCQLHGGTHLYSWAITHNTYDRQRGEPSYLGGWDVNCLGLLIAFNKIPSGWVGNAVIRKGTLMQDAAIVKNEATKILPDPEDKPGKKTPDRFDGLTWPVREVPNGTPSAPQNVQVEPYQKVAVKIVWTDTANNEIGFRVERKIADQRYAVIAYRPPQIQKSPENPPQWIDFTAPPGKPLTYRVVAIGGADDDAGASPPTKPVTLPPLR